MQKVPLAPNPTAYLAALSGWQKPGVEALRSEVLASAALDERVKWGNLVYFSKGPVLMIRSEPERILFGFWRGQLLRHIESRLKPGGKYQMATLELGQRTPLDREIVRQLVAAAVALNDEFGDPTKLTATAS